MRKVFVLLLSLLLVSTVAAIPVATDSYIEDPVVSMDPYEYKLNKFCVNFIDEDNVTTPASGLEVVIDIFCKDNNGLVGCQQNDTKYPGDFWVITIDPVTQYDGCAMFGLQTLNANGNVV